MPAKFELLNSDNRVVYEATARGFFQAKPTPLKETVTLSYSGDDLKVTNPADPNEHDCRVFQLNSGPQADANLYVISPTGEPTDVPLALTDTTGLFPGAIVDSFILRAIFIESG